MQEFLTVKDAARLTGKSPSSIRRIIYPIIRDDSHPDRAQVEPTVEEVRALRMKGENFAWRLSEELLRREVPIVAEGPQGIPTWPKSAASAEGEFLAMLRRELDIKNQQITQQAELIAKQMELVNGLGERLREGNILIASLQRQLALPDGRDNKAADGSKPERTSSTATKKWSTIAGKASKPKKRRWLARMFGTRP